MCSRVNVRLGSVALTVKSTCVRGQAAYCVVVQKKSSCICFCSRTCERVGRSYDGDSCGNDDDDDAECGGAGAKSHCDNSRGKKKDISFYSFARNLAQGPRTRIPVENDVTNGPTNGNVVPGNGNNEARDAAPEPNVTPRAGG